MIFKNCSSHLKDKVVSIFFVATLPLFLYACTLADIPLVGQYFGGSGGGGNAGAGPADLMYWGIWENPQVMNAVINKYTEANPDVTVNYDDRSVLSAIEHKERSFLRAEDESGPDIMRVHVSWMPRLRNSLVPMPSGLINTDDFRNSIYPVAQRNLIFDGNIYGLPAYYDGLVLVYNRDHFDEIGQLEPPTAWEEFRKLALELTIRGENDQIVRAGAAMGSASNIDFFADIIGMLFSQAGVSLPDELDGRAAADALTFYTNFVKEDAVWSNDYPEASVAFAQGRVSMIFVPSWNLIDIINTNPDLNVGVAVPPQALPDSPATWGSFWVDVVPKSSKNPDAAWRFLAFMAQPEQQFFIFNEASKFRTFGAPYAYTNLADELSANPYVRPVLQTAPYANTFEFASRAGNRRQENAIREAVTQMLGRASAADVLPAVKQELSQ